MCMTTEIRPITSKNSKKLQLNQECGNKYSSNQTIKNKNMASRIMYAAEERLQESTSN